MATQASAVCSMVRPSTFWSAKGFPPASKWVIAKVRRSLLWGNAHSRLDADPLTQIRRLWAPHHPAAARPVAHQECGIGPESRAGQCQWCANQSGIWLAGVQSLDGLGENRVRRGVQPPDSRALPNPHVTPGADEQEGICPTEPQLCHE